MSCGRRQFTSFSTRESGRVAEVYEPSVEHLLELRLEIAALQQENSAYARQDFHTAAQRHTHGLRRERLEAIKQDLTRLRPSRRS
jgi:hypothetical protein